MTAINSIAVFCGSRVGANPAYAEAGRALGQGLAEAGIRLVYGGGRVGMMGVVADSTLAHGGSVLGIIPDFLLSREVAHGALTQLIVTDSMHSRKLRMAEESDAFLCMPGGLGTLDETLEIITWRQLGLHAKPILLCDVGGSVRPFVAAIDAAVAQGFVDPAVRNLFEVLDGVPAVLNRVKARAVSRGV